MENQTQEQTQKERIRDALTQDWQTTSNIIKSTHIHPYKVKECLEALVLEGIAEKMDYLQVIKKWRLKANGDFLEVQSEVVL